MQGGCCLCQSRMVKSGSSAGRLHQLRERVTSMEDIPPAIHEIAVYTEALEVRGEVKAWPPRRILDVLNSQQTPYLEVEQASIIPLSRWGKAQPRIADSVVLNKQEIILVWLIRETEVKATEFTTVHKVPQRVIAYAGPFVAQGTMHMLRESSLSQAMDATREKFFALTSPSVFCLSVPELTLKEGIVLSLNKDQVAAMQAGG